mmetsp:Transcript_33693/g.77749  ORF Transcript_33693/g.77749 Transcript_33693/m.77749 type:complete len:478 (-) Transcript_33693:233-1666(-)
MKTLCSCWIAITIEAANSYMINGWISTLKNPLSISRLTNDANNELPETTRIHTDINDPYASEFSGRRDMLAITASIAGCAVGGVSCVKNANALGLGSGDEKEKYTLKFPTLFAPLYGEAYRKTIKRPLRVGTDTKTPGTDDNIWALEQNLELGPLQTPIRCTVIRLKDGTLWVHAPLAPTQEFFDLVESCGSGDKEGVAHVVVPTYALEHKVFVKDALQRWHNAQLWTSPGQFSFPFAVPNEFIFGKVVNGVLGSSIYDGQKVPPWSDEIEYASLEAGTFNIGGKSTTLYETAFFHKASKSLIVTDAVAQIPKYVPPLNNPEQLLLISKRSTSDPMPNDTPQSRLDGWEKTALLVSYFFPEHEELNPEKVGVVTWTEGWHDNFNALAGRLIVPPVVRTLIYAQNPARVQKWVDEIVDGQWDFDQIVPAHFEAPISATPKEFAAAFRFLKDDNIDAFPKNDLARGLKPIADIALKRLL